MEKIGLEKEDSIEGPTLNLAIINIVVYIITTIWSKSFITGPVPLAYLGLQISNFLNGLYWTPITSLFVHSNIAHLGGNVLFLFIYGFKLEDEGFEDRAVYLGYIFTGVLAGILSAPIFGVNSVQVGASGAVFGLLGIVVGYLRRNGDPAYKRALYTSVILFILAFGPRTNVFAHLFGLIFGIILGSTDYFNDLRKIPDEELKKYK